VLPSSRISLNWSAAWLPQSDTVDHAPATAGAGNKASGAVTASDIKAG